MKRLGKEKAAELEAKAPGCTLSGWLELNYKHVTLTNTISQGGKRLAVPQVNIELTIALLSTDNVADWAKTAFHWCPAGTIVDKVPQDYYQEKVLLLRQLLTKMLLTDPDNRMARRYLDILERRDAERWAVKKAATTIRATAAESVTDANGAADGSKRTVTFDFNIVD